jgi:Arc/MetJ family transcription regulator
MAITRTTFAIISILLTLPAIVPAQTQNDTFLALQNANNSIQEMQKMGFPTTRPSDILLEAQQIFLAQTALEEQKGNPDYTLVLERLQKIESIKRQAIETNDELKALEIQIEELDIDTKHVKEIYNQAVEEFNAERYERAKEKIELAYKKIQNSSPPLPSFLPLFMPAGQI